MRQRGINNRAFYVVIARFLVSSLVKRAVGLGLILATLLNLGPLSETQTVYAAPNYQINYQGKLTDSAGDAVADGDYDIVFKLYTVASGGTAIWTESHTGANDVTVTDGLFSVMLGSITSLNSINFNQTLYLGVTVEADSEMTPRKVLGAVPAAFEADKLDGLTSDDFLSTSTAEAPKLWSLTGLGRVGSSTASTTFLGNLATVGATVLSGLLSVYERVSAPYFTATSTSIASVFPYASTTAITVSGTASTTNLIVSNSAGLTIATLNGPLHAANGVVGATTTIGVRYGGTGLTADPSYGQLLVGNTSGGYTLTATSSLGIALSDTTGTLSIDRGGTNNTAYSTNAILHFDGTRITATSSDPLYVGRVVATSSLASNLPYASTTYLSASTASTSNLIVSTAFTFKDVTGFLKATAGAVATALVDLTADVTGVLGISNGGTNATGFSSSNPLAFDGTRIAATSTPTASYFIATSTSIASVFPYASTTALTISGAGNALNVSNANATSTFAGGVTFEDTAFVYDGTSQNIGIGTAVPSKKLEINGASAAEIGQEIENSSTGDSALHFLLTGARRWIMGIDNSDSDSFKISTGGTALGTGDVVTLTTDGNVGIGTTTPGAQLTASSTANVGLIVDQRGTSDILRLLDSGSPILTVADGGTVGIGTTTPGALLSLSTNNIGLMVNQTGTNDIVRLLDNGSTVFTVADGGLFGFATSTISGSKIQIGGTQNTSAGEGGTGEFLRLSGVINFNSNGDTGAGIVVRPSVVNAGTVNIVQGINVQPTLTSNSGQITNYAGVRVADPGGANAMATSSVGFLYGNHPGGTVDYSIYVNSADNVYLGTGNVGVGSTTPGTVLSLGSTGNNTINLSTSATSTFGTGINLRGGCFAIGGTCISGGGGGTINSGITGQIPYYASNGTTLTATSSIYVSSSGFIGIGTTTPFNKVHLEGDPGAWGFTYGLLGLSALTTNNPVYLTLKSSYGLREIWGVGAGRGLLNTSDFVLYNFSQNVEKFIIKEGSSGEVYINPATSQTGTALTASSTFISSGLLGSSGQSPANGGTSYISSGGDATLANGGNGGTLYLAIGGNANNTIGTQTGGAGGTVNIANGGSGSLVENGGAGGIVTLVAGGVGTVSNGNDGTVTIGHSSGKKNATLNVYGTTTVMFKGNATTNGVCHTGSDLDGADSTNTYSLVACSSGPGDVAEMYSTYNDVEAGDIVSMGDDTITYEASGADPYTGQVYSLGMVTMNKMRKAELGDAAIAGIISTAPFQTFGKDVLKVDPQAKPLALVGRVPVKVNLEGGPIKAGDKITLSSVPGVGKKATSSGITVGMALQDYEGPGEGKVLVLVNLNDTKVDEAIVGGGLADSALWTLDGETGKIKPFAALDLNNTDMINVRSIQSASGNWSIAEDGTLVVKTVKTEKLCVGSVCIDEEDLAEILEEVGIDFLVSDEEGGGEETATSSPEEEEGGGDTASTTEPLTDDESNTPAPEAPPEPAPSDGGGETEAPSSPAESEEEPPPGAESEPPAEPEPEPEPEPESSPPLEPPPTETPQS